MNQMPTRTAARRSAAGLAAGSAAVSRPGSQRPARPARYCDASGRPARTQVVAVSRVSAPRAERSRVTAPPAMRLTRRGRVLIVLLAAAVLLAVFSLGRVSSRAADAGGTRAARPTVVLQSGETLWQVARRVSPKADPRVTVERILQLNDLKRADMVQPGQQLLLP